jgi:hypothetical protein
MSGSILPRTVVALDGGTATVYPLGLRHFDQFRKIVTAIAGLWSKISEAVVYEKDPQTGEERVRVANPEALREAMASEFIGTSFDPMVEIIDDCTSFAGEIAKEVKSIRDLPHWVAPEILRAWIEISFFPIAEKFLPWANLFQKTLTSINLGDHDGGSTTLSGSSSDPGSPSNPS